MKFGVLVCTGRSSACTTTLGTYGRASINSSVPAVSMPGQRTLLSAYCPIRANCAASTTTTTLSDIPDVFLGRET